MVRSIVVGVSGMGAVSALGIGCRALLDGVRLGRSGIRPIERFDTSPFGIHLGATVPGWDAQETGESAQSPCVSFAVSAISEAILDASLSSREVTHPRTALVVGTSLGEVDARVHDVTEAVASFLGLRGPRITVSTACTSSTNAIGLGLDLLRGGFVDRVLAGGTDVLNPTVFAGFNALGVLSPGRCAPFGLPVGTTLGEGAGFLVLETREERERRGAPPGHGWVAGYGLSADAFHETSPDPTGSGVARAIRAALADASLPPGDIDYVNAHGSGTESNDPAEWTAIRTVFESRARTLPVSSVKGHLGHAQGAAGVLELIVTLQGIQHRFVPPTLHCETRRPRGPEDPVAQVAPRPGAVHHAVCSNSAFGGANAALVVSRDPPTSGAGRGQPAPGAPGLRLRVVGLGSAGVALPPDGSTASRGRSPRGGRNAALEGELTTVAPTVDPRDLDTQALLVTVATGRALADAQVQLTGTTRDQVALVVGTTTISPESGAAFHRSVRRRGLARCSTTAFARLVLNAAGGSAAKALSIRGPASTVSVGWGSGLLAFLYSCWLAGSPRRAPLAASVAVDTPYVPNPGDAEDWQGRAVSLVVSRQDGAPDGPFDRSVWVAGWGLAGPGRAGSAVAAALGNLGFPGPAVDLVALLPSDQEGVLDRFRVDARDRGRELVVSLGRSGPATAPLLALGDTVQRIRGGEIGSALVVADDGRSAASAVLLTTECNGNVRD